MYLNCTVKVPDVPGKITVKKKGNSSYVLLETSRIYLPERQYTKVSRVIIGKVSESDSSSMQPNETFEEYFPTVLLPETLPESNRCASLHVGSYLLIKKVLEEYKIPTTLEKWLGKDTGLALDLVAYMIIDEKNEADHFRSYARTHPLFTQDMRIYSDEKICRLLASITDDEILGFLNDWNRKRDHHQRIYVSYDSTNKNCQAGDIELVEFGKAKDNARKPIFNLSIAYDKTNKVPLFYEEYLGSIPDVADLKIAVQTANDYGYDNVGFVLDRGYFSEGNIHFMDDNGHSFIMMVKGQKQLVSALVESRMHSFETDHHHLIRPYTTYGITLSHKLYDSDKSERYFHIYFNEALCHKERNDKEREIEKQRKDLERIQGEIIGDGKKYEDHFQLYFDKDKHLLYAKKKYDVIARELSLCGYFCIISSEEMTAEGALLLYKGRDVSEKLFSSDKTFIGSKSDKVHSEKSLKAKLFLEFVALIVRNRIYNLEKEAMTRKKGKLEKMSVPEVFDYMEELEISIRGKGKYRLSHAITALQRKILAAFGISEDNVLQEVHDISNILSQYQTEEEEVESNG